MTPIEQRSYIGKVLIKLLCRILKGHFGTRNSFYFADPKNPRCSICGEILTEENHFRKFGGYYNEF